MLEDLLRSLIAALNANTEALGGKPSAGAGAGTGTSATVAKIAAVATAAAAAVAPAKKPAADKPTMEMVKAALMEVKDAHGRPAAMKIVKEEGNATELPGIKPARFTAVLAACKAIMEPADADADEEEAVDEDDL
jgi:hypothetical protein